MNNCIICKQEKTLTNEHIIPEFLGGGLVIKAVCKPCNDKMGKTFEGRLSKNPIFTFPNFINGVSGKSKKIPNPLEGKKQTVDGEPVKVNFENDKFKVKKHLKVSMTKTEDGDMFSLSMDPSDLDKARGIIKTKIDRFYSNEPEIYRRNLCEKLHQDLLNSKITETENPVVRGSFEVNLKDIRLLFAKIAYEAGFHHFGIDFTRQAVAEDLRKALYTGDESNINGNMLPDMAELKGLFSEQKHYIYLCRNICYVKIYDREAVVVISNLKSDFDIPTDMSVIYEFSYKDGTWLKKSLQGQINYLNKI